VSENRTTRRALALAATLAVAITLGAGCGKSSTKETVQPKASSSVDSALAAKVPASVKSDGKILIGTDSTYAPSEFIEGSKIVGFDVDLFNAVAAKLGLKTEWVSANFGTIVEGVKSGKYEAGVSSFTVNADREKQVNMVSYFSAGTQWAVKKGNPTGLTPDNACGKRVAVQKDTVQVDDVTGRSKKCTQAGKGAIKIDQYQAQSDATTAVVSGKDDAMLADSPVVAYAVKQTNGQLETAGAIYDAAPYGYAIPKDQTDFAQAIADAVKALITDGTYKRILQTWGVDQGAIDNPQVNPSA
jgi:polar amino acid transport system substrate-binding protein